MQNIVLRAPDRQGSPFADAGKMAIGLREEQGHDQALTRSLHNVIFPQSQGICGRQGLAKYEMGMPQQGWLVGTAIHSSIVLVA